MTIDLDQRNGIQMASEMAEVYFGRPFASDSAFQDLEPLRLLFLRTPFRRDALRFLQTSRNRRIAMAEPSDPINTPTNTTTMPVENTSPPVMRIALNTLLESLPPPA